MTSDYNEFPLQMIALVEASGTGTKLLQSCLDGSAEIISIPAYPLVYLYPNFNEWKNKYGEMLSWDKFYELLIYNHSSIIDSNSIPGFNGLNQLGQERDQSIRIDKDIFKKEFMKFTKDSEVNMTNALIAIHKAWHLAVGNSLDQVKAIVFHLHNDIYLEYLCQDFPNAKVIGFIRDPRPNCIKRTEVGWTIDQEKLNATDAFLHRMRVFPNLCIYFFFHIYNLYRYTSLKNIKIIKHEDLYYDLEGKMRGLCDWLEISYTPNMLELTFNGLPWWSDKIYGNEQTNKVSKSVISEKWKEQLSWKDCFVIEGISSALFKKYSYNFFKFKNSAAQRILLFILIFLPMRLEIEAVLHLLSPLNFIQFLKNSFIESGGTTNLKDYSFSATYRHKWDYKPMKYFKNPWYRSMLSKPNLIKRVIYILVMIVKYFVAIIEIPIEVWRRQIIMLSLFFNKGTFNNLPEKI